MKKLLKKYKETNERIRKIFNSNNGIAIINNNVVVTEYSESLECDNCGHRLPLGEKFSFCGVCGYNYRERNSEYAKG